MSKTDRSSAIQRVVPSAIVTAPDFMQGEVVLGTEQLKQYVTPPRLKVVQKMASSELLNVVGVGDVITVPNVVSVCEVARSAKGAIDLENTEPFYVVPLFFFVEWCTWNPLDARGTLPSIRARSLDPTSDIARKSKDATLRIETIDKMQVRHVEHLNFIVMLHGHPTLTDPVVMPFSKSEHKAGRNFAGLIRMRKAPIYGCVFECHVGARSNNQGEWYGIDVINPGADISPWVQKDEFDAYKVMHQEFVKLHEEARILIQHEDDGAPADDAGPQQF